MSCRREFSSDWVGRSVKSLLAHLNKPESVLLQITPLWWLQTSVYSATASVCFFPLSLCTVSQKTVQLVWQYSQTACSVYITGMENTNRLCVYVHSITCRCTCCDKILSVVCVCEWLQCFLTCSVFMLSCYQSYHFFSLHQLFPYSLSVLLAKPAGVDEARAVECVCVCVCLCVYCAVDRAERFNWHPQRELYKPPNALCMCVSYFSASWCIYVCVCARAHTSKYVNTFFVVYGDRSN